MVMDVPEEFEDVGDDSQTFYTAKEGGDQSKMHEIYISEILHLCKSANAKLLERVEISSVKDVYEFNFRSLLQSIGAKNSDHGKIMVTPVEGEQNTYIMSFMFRYSILNEIWFNDITLDSFYYPIRFGMFARPRKYLDQIITEAFMSNPGYIVGEAYLGESENGSSIAFNVVIKSTNQS